MDKQFNLNEHLSEGIRLGPKNGSPVQLQQMGKFRYAKLIMLDNKLYLGSADDKNVDQLALIKLIDKKSEPEKEVSEIKITKVNYYSAEGVPE